MQTSKYPLLLTIVGFIYINVIFFFILLIYNVKDLMFLEKILAYHFYVILILIPLSYLIGLTVHKMINEIIVPYLLEKKITYKILRRLKLCNEKSVNKYNIKDDFYFQQYANQNLFNKIQSGIGIFYASRLLFVGFILLTFSLFFWLWQNNYRCDITILFFVLALLTHFIYRKSRKANDIRIEAIKFLKNENSK
jgi:hypothetical protein